MPARIVNVESGTQARLFENPTPDAVAGGTVTFDVTVAAAATVIAQADATKALAVAAPAGQAVVAAQADATKALAPAAPAGQAAVTVALTGGGFAATIAGQAAIVVAESTQLSLAATVAGQASIAVATVATKTFSATISGQASITTALADTQALAATVAGQSTVTVAVAVTRSLTVTVAAGATVSATWPSAPVTSLAAVIAPVAGSGGLPLMFGSYEQGVGTTIQAGMSPVVSKSLAANIAPGSLLGTGLPLFFSAYTPGGGTAVSASLQVSGSSGFQAVIPGAATVTVNAVRQQRFSVSVSTGATVAASFDQARESWFTPAVCAPVVLTPATNDAVTLTSTPCDAVTLAYQTVPGAGASGLPILFGNYTDASSTSTVDTIVGTAAPTDTIVAVAATTEEH